MRVVGIVIALSAPACGRAAPADEPAPAPEAELEVNNQAFLDMTIYVLRAGVRQRIGVAPGLTRTSFKLQRYIIGNGGEFQFLADPIGSNRTPVSQRIWVEPGDVVQMTITP